MRQMMRFVNILFLSISLLFISGNAFAAIQNDDEADKQALKKEMDEIKLEVKALIEEIKEEIRLEQIKLKKEMAELKREMAGEKKATNAILNKVRTQSQKDKEKTKKALEESKNSARQIKEESALELQKQKDISQNSAEEMNQALSESKNEYNKINKETSKVLEELQANSVIDKEEQKRLMEEAKKEVANAIKQAREEQEESKKIINDINNDIKKSALAETASVLAESKEAFRGIADDAKKAALADTSSALEEMRKYKTKSHNIGEKIKRNLNENQGTSKGQLIKEKLEQESVIKNARKLGQRKVRVAKANAKDVALKKKQQADRKLKRKLLKEARKKKKREKLKAKKEREALQLARQTTAEKRRTGKSSGQKKGTGRKTRSRKFTLAKQTGAEGKKGRQGAEQNLGRRAKSVAGISGFKQLEKGDIFLVEEALYEEDLSKERERKRLRLLEEERQESQREILRKFFQRIRSLQKKLERRQVAEAPALMKLGSIYMDSQHFLDSLSKADRSRLFNKESHLIPGGAELAIVAYKMALERRPTDGRLSLTLGEIYDEMGDNENAELFGRKALALFSQSRQARQVRQTKEFLKTINKKINQPEILEKNSGDFNIQPASF